MTAEVSHPVPARRVLMLSFYFPPHKGSSGIQRTLGFCRYLPALGWEPVILTAHPRAYPNVSATAEDPLPGVHVERAFALDTARHLAILGRYPRLLALPDRWWSWWPGAVWSGRRLLARFRPDIIWSTSPIATAHLAAASLHRHSGVPWVADLRDPMTEPGYPADPLLFRAMRAVEQRTVQEAARVVLVTRGALDMYRRRYPDVTGERWACIENGFEEADFSRLEAVQARHVLNNSRGGPVKLLHSGTIYRRERDPEPFLRALANLLNSGRLRRDELQVTLRASGNDTEYGQLIAQLQLGGTVQLAADLAYEAALAEMTGADGLLLLQGPACNSQIPAKTYEYLRAGRPILGLTDEDGDTGRLLRSCGVEHVVSLIDVAGIERALFDLVRAIQRGAAITPRAESVAGHSRRAAAARLADLFDSLAGPSR